MTRVAPPDATFDVEAIRREFPVLRETVRGRPLVYLDSAASAQKPQPVIDAEREVYERSYSNVHRGVHHLSMVATESYEKARGKVRRFLGAAASREIVLLRGTTEAVNLVAQAYGRAHVGAGDEVLVTGLEHHSNIVPWQLLCGEKGAALRVAPIDDTGEVDMAAFERLLSPRTRIVSVAHVSNALGTVSPVRRMTELGHAAGAVVMIDGAQAAPHLAVDVQAIGCDFYAFSGHKVYGPSGVGALYGKAALLEAMPPWQGGGDMIASVTFEKSTWNELPYKFEAGTPNIAGGIALGAAIDWVDKVGLGAIAAHEHELLEYGTGLLERLPGLRLVGTAREKAGVLSFVLDGIHPHDVGTILDYDGIAVRTGHHCAQPVMDRFGIPATTRASLACFNTREELDALARGIGKVQEMFK
ncbi:MAG TPA: cysteine desulfurase [Vicinamibacteria bacterium]|nr:cysteine desulfurase [Vicinamibacteria bacterium]